MLFELLLKVTNDKYHKLREYEVKSVVHQRQLRGSQVTDWGLKMLGIPDLWKETRGEGINVAVLDTGITNMHADLAGSVWKYKNFTTQDYLNVDDYVGHGTHCAGIIRAHDNECGVVGVAPKCNLMIGKVLNDQGYGRETWIAKGIRWAVDNKAHIISMSLGGPGFNKELADAVQYAIDNNVVVIAAAGNSGEGDDTIGFPGAYPGVITVGSINCDRERSDYSSTGPSIEIMAPGEDILSCFPENKYATLSGTSMACPFIAGIAALILAHDLAQGQDIEEYEYCNASEYILECLIETADDMEEKGFDNNSGWGLVNPEKSIHHKK